MAEILTFGIASFKIAAIDPITGLASGALASIGDIYKDTCDLTEAEPTETKIYAEQSVNPRKVLSTPGEETLKFSLMSTAADSLQTMLGGTVTTVATVKTWNKSKTPVVIEKFVEIITLDGTKIEMPRVSFTGKKNFQFRRNNIILIDVMGTILNPLIDAVPAIRITEPS